MQNSKLVNRKILIVFLFCFFFSNQLLYIRVGESTLYQKMKYGLLL